MFGTVTRIGSGRQRNPSSILVKDERCISSLKRPHLLSGPPNLLLNGYRRLIPRNKAAGLWSWPLAFYRAEDISGSIPVLPHVPSWRRWGSILPLLYVLICLFVIYLMKSVIQTMLCRRAAWRVGSESERRCKEAGVFPFGGRCRYYCGRTEESHE